MCAYAAPAITFSFGIFVCSATASTRTQRDPPTVARRRQSTRATIGGSASVASDRIAPRLLRSCSSEKTLFPISPLLHLPNFASLNEERGLALRYQTVLPFLSTRLGATVPHRVNRFLNGLGRSLRQGDGRQVRPPAGRLPHASRCSRPDRVAV